MKRKIKIIAIVFAALFLAAQLVRPDNTNPPIVEAETLESSTQVPENVEAILARSCSDCHTNKTTYPWYSNITPSNWFLAHHVEDGRRNMNFSVWNTYETSRKRRKLDQICEQVSSGEMPLPSYLWIHRDARLSEEDKKILCDWADGEKARLAQTAAQ